MGTLPALPDLIDTDPTSAAAINDNFATVRDFINRELAAANQFDADNLATPCARFAWTGSWEHAANPRTWASIQMVMPSTKPHIETFQAYYGTTGAPTSDLTLKLLLWDPTTSTWGSLGAIVFHSSGADAGTLQVVTVDQDVIRTAWLKVEAYDDTIGSLDYSDLSFSVIIRDTLQEA